MLKYFHVGGIKNSFVILIYVAFLHLFECIHIKYLKIHFSKHKQSPSTHLARTD